MQQAQHAKVTEVAIAVGWAQVLRDVQGLTSLVEGLAIVRAIVGDARQTHVQTQFTRRGLQLPVKHSQRLRQVVRICQQYHEQITRQLRHHAACPLAAPGFKLVFQGLTGSLPGTLAVGQPMALEQAIHAR
ncbi:hypothetical protein D3C76_1057140 [compost metagenome]